MGGGQHRDSSPASAFKCDSTLDSYTTKSPILITTFTRLDTIKRVFSAVSKVKPPRIYISSNHWRNDDEKAKVQAVREYLLKNISWDCEVKTRFLTSHVAVKYSISGAISWFFAHEAQGIILEDDCVPNVSLFAFIDEMLDLYKDNEKIFAVSGWSALDFAPQVRDSLKESYFFSKYGHIWGWGTWRRVWEKYELENAHWERDFSAFSFDSAKERRYWRKVFGAYFSGKINTWDYPFGFVAWRNRALAIYPKYNMCQNIGFNRADAQNCVGESKFENMATYEINFPLNHPREIRRNVALDKLDFTLTFAPPNIFVRIINKLARILLKRNVIRV